ncbi:TetR/AcrR family transcriptional regulator [Glycomyces salinus]|uniref:TetR/AcrR family transcriptional regulator n=1 Tax=Glycomyces salinus TaxID=980294 RepID=UPI0018ED6A30|nr:TetR/AcrR family transcriptional regulator [Glycomyces salinus]
MSQREDLLEGAKRCLIEKGYRRTTARDIVTASGAHLASIGYHFGSKDRLMNTAVLELSSEWGDRLEQRMRAAAPSGPAQRIELLVQAVVESGPEERDLMVASLYAYAEVQFDERMRAELAAQMREARTVMAAIVLGVPESEADDERGQALGAAVYALLTGHLVQALADPGAIPPAGRVLDALGAVLSEPAAD